jgi:putative tryptophan/tyrosine transport system substrate-binding protein
MQRREFITLLGGTAATWPLRAQAQQPERMRRIGVLIGGSESDAERQGCVAAFRSTLQGLGWVEGRNLRIDLRWAEANVDHVRAYAVDLVALTPNVLFGDNTFVIFELQRATRAIPIIFARVADPIASGFVDGLARPGGNITGFADAETQARSKLVELMREIAPAVMRIAFLWAPLESWPRVLETAEAAASLVGLRAIRAPVQEPRQIEEAIIAMAKEPNAGLIIVSDPFTLLHRKLIVELAARYKLPAVYGNTIYVEDGGLASYGADQVEEYRGAARYVDRILKGEKPANLPVQNPVKYELAINLKTAKVLGLEVPFLMQQRADKLIDR